MQLPTPFRRKVPLVGQPIEILGWTLVVPVTCKCENPQTLQVILQQTSAGLGQSLSRCPACQQLFRIQKLSMNQAGELEFIFEVVKATEAANPAEASQVN